MLPPAEENQRESEFKRSIDRAKVAGFSLLLVMSAAMWGGIYLVVEALCQ